MLSRAEKERWMGLYLALERELDAMTEADFGGAAGDAVRDRMDGPWRVAASNGFLNELRAASVAQDMRLHPLLYG